MTLATWSLHHRAGPGTPRSFHGWWSGKRYDVLLRWTSVGCHHPPPTEWTALPKNEIIILGPPPTVQTTAGGLPICPIPNRARARPGRKRQKPLRTYWAYNRPASSAAYLTEPVRPGRRSSRFLPRTASERICAPTHPRTEPHLSRASSSPVETCVLVLSVCLVFAHPRVSVCGPSVLPLVRPCRRGVPASAPRRRRGSSCSSRGPRGQPRGRRWRRRAPFSTCCCRGARRSSGPSPPPPTARPRPPRRAAPPSAPPAPAGGPSPSTTRRRTTRAAT